LTPQKTTADNRRRQGRSISEPIQSWSDGALTIERVRKGVEIGARAVPLSNADAIAPVAAVTAADRQGIETLTGRSLQIACDAGRLNREKTLSD
jgi:hypothetical protein